jgi:hypothetical protein
MSYSYNSQMTPAVIGTLESFDLHSREALQKIRRAKRLANEAAAADPDSETSVAILLLLDHALADLDAALRHRHQLVPQITPADTHPIAG